MKLNEKILYYRKAAGLSQEELADQVGVSRQAVSKWETGESMPEVGKLVSLAQAFGVSTDELLSEAEPVQASQAQGQAQEQEPPQAQPSPIPSEDSFDKAVGLFGRLVKRYGWLSGVYVALSGLGLTIVGALARWGFGAMFSASNDMMSGFGPMGGGWSYSGPPELESEIMAQLGISTPAASPFGGIERFFLGVPTVIIVTGVLIMIAGGVLAAVLYQKGHKK